MGLGIVRPQGDRLAIVRGGVCRASERPIGEADIVVALGDAIVARDRLADQVDRDVVASDLVREHAEVM
jgi:hypothetical protein